MKPIQKILVANRGEIAVRVMRTCRRMGIATVAVFSDADARAVHVRQADEAVRIGPAPSGESYLVIERIVDAARRTGADAIHPGFGFLSERAEFAEACTEAGLVFIGPSPQAMRAMGLKKEAKEIALKADVPVVPGYSGDDGSVENLSAKASEIGFPVLIKASAGGGGKGMRVCGAKEDLRAAIESAKREALGAFGDDTLLIEKYVERPRHVEFQILGDQFGNVVHLFERECSIQRRHQKIVEESPSLALSKDLRERMGRSAVTLGRAIGYENAGTVEFIVGPDGSYYFLEVNARLQVEHPVTECVTGLDLVEEQIRIARGEPLGYGQADLTQTGAAVECRIYAEDPSRQFLPASGKLVDWHVPDVHGLRVDTGVETGDEVSIHYDPMIAKVITHGNTRLEAHQRMIRALEGLSIQGVRNNREFLIATLRHPAYVAGELHTHFIDQHLKQALTPTPDHALRDQAAVAATLLSRELRTAAMRPAVRPGFRNNYFCDARVVYTVDEEPLEVCYRSQRDGTTAVRVGDCSMQTQVVERTGPEIVLEFSGLRRRFRVVSQGAHHFVQVHGHAFTLIQQPRFPDLLAERPQGACVAPMPGKVVQVDVEVGQKVEEGQRLLVMEAMKMEHPLTAGRAGTVTDVCVTAGEQVQADALLVVVESA